MHVGATPEQQAAIRDMMAKNVPMREIARAVRISHTRINDVIAAMGLPGRKAKREAQREQIIAMHKAGHGYRTICAALQVGDYTVRNVIRDVRSEPTPATQRVKWSDAEIADLIAGWDSAIAPGENAKRAAERIGRPLYSVLTRAKGCGLMGKGVADPYQPSPERADKHAAACLREGGFPTAHVIDGRAVWVYPTLASAA